MRYTGWSSIAIWINLTTAATESGAPISGPAGIAGQLAILAGATAVAILRWTRGLLAYAAAVAWAFAGVVSGASAAGETTLTIAAGPRRRYRVRAMRPVAPSTEATAHYALKSWFLIYPTSSGLRSDIA